MKWICVVIMIVSAMVMIRACERPQQQGMDIIRSGVQP